MRVQPDSLAKFYAFKAELQGMYPLRKDLAKAPAFVKFTNGGDDIRFEPERMIVPLMDMLQSPQRSHHTPLKPDQDQQGLVFETISGSTAPLKPDQDKQGLIFEAGVGSAVPLNERNPFCLLDDEIDELLRGLEEVDFEEVKALDIDHELSAVLNMNVDDFVL